MILKDTRVLSCVLCCAVCTVFTAGLFHSFKSKKAGLILKQADLTRSVSEVQKAAIAKEFLNSNRTELQGVLADFQHGKNHRLTWVGLLEQAKQQVPVPELSFKIHPRRLFDKSEANSDLVVGWESLDLSVALENENQLSSLLKFLSLNVPFHFELTELEIERQTKVIDNGITAPKVIRLLMSCKLRWYTFELGKEREV